MIDADRPARPSRSLRIWHLAAVSAVLAALMGLARTGPTGVGVAYLLCWGVVGYWLSKRALRVLRKSRRRLGRSSLIMGLFVDTMTFLAVTTFVIWLGVMGALGVLVVTLSLS
jgi:hypothetical protein